MRCRKCGWEGYGLARHRRVCGVAKAVPLPEVITERWRPVPSFSGYWASSLGRLMGPSGKVLHLNGLNSARERPYIAPSVGGVQTRVPAHVMICEAFHGLRPAGLMIRHLDGKPANTRPDNLAYGTAKENQHDRIAHGTANRGERHNFAKLTEDEVREIRALRAHKISAQDIADVYGIGVSTVLQIASGFRWGHVDPADFTIKITPHAAAEARRLRQQAAEAQLFLVMTPASRVKTRRNAADRVRHMIARAERLEGVVV